MGLAVMSMRYFYVYLSACNNHVKAEDFFLKPKPIMGTEYDIHMDIL